MKNHLTPDEIAMAVSGLELESAAAEHLESCVVCRAEAVEFEDLITARRGDMLRSEPDWEDHAERVMDRLPSEVGVHGRFQPRWWRPVLAVAAVAVLAVGLGMLRPDRSVEPPVGEPSVEEILAETDELLSDDGIPGFEIIDPELDDLTTYFDNGAS